MEKVLITSDNPVHLGILIALYGGLRIGEVCALQWGDIQFDNSIIKVTKTVMRINDLSPNARTKTKVVITSPKTDSSIRSVPIPAFLTEYLEPFRKADNIYILTDAKSFMEPRLCLKKYKKYLAKAGLEQYTFHALRHTYATRCIEKNMDVKILSEILGHANVSTTLQRYVHPSMDLKKSQVNRFESFCFESKSEFL